MTESSCSSGMGPTGCCRFSKMGLEETDALYGTDDCGRALCKELGCCTMNSLPAPFRLKDLVKGLQIIFEHDKVEIEFVKQYMGMYKSNRKEWGKYSIFDKHKYTRNLVDTGNGKYNLIVLCWNLSQGSTIHSHAGSHCFMKILEGSVQEEQFDMPNPSEGEREMKKLDTFNHTRDEVAYIADDLGKVHRVSNPSHMDQAVTLHLYAPPFEECSIYDERTSHENTGKMTFWSKNGKLVVDSEDITVENAIASSFDQSIRLQLDPIWHQLGPKTKQLVSDLKTLRLILRHLTQYDCVTFYNMVNSVRTSEKTFGQNTGWLFLDSADSLFVQAKRRVYRSTGGQKKAKTGNEKESVGVMLEACPKWEALQQVIDEISEHNTKSGDTPGRVLIAADDDRTCAQIKEFLCDGSESLLARLYNRSLANKGEYLDELKQKAVNRKKKPSKDKDTVTLTQMVAKTTANTEENDLMKEQSSICSSQDAYYGVLPDPVTIIHPLHGNSDSFSLVRTLAEVQPRYVILYDPDMEFVRQLEVYRASHPDTPLRVYFLMYTGSVEEQRYLTTLRKEKESFEYLIREKATMVIPEERDGKMENDIIGEATPANTRKGGNMTANTSQKKVIVDMREFRSELPSLIHRRGMTIEPVTLEVGDYILTPEICVERKSISDLIGSLNNGRLYNQCTAMCRYYQRPVLLIEFDPNKSFTLQGKYPMSHDVSMQETTTRLTLLTMLFPKLRILWCQSPYATAELFEELKTGRGEPDASQAMAVTCLDDGTERSDKYSHNCQDMLLRMPGLNTKNYRNIMNRVTDIAELCTLTEEELTGIMGSSQNARLLWNFLHKKHNSVDTSKTAKTEPAKRWNKRKR